MAVHTHLSRSEIETCLLNYEIGKLVTFSGIAQGVENTNYRVTSSSGKFILTLFEKRVDPVDLPFFLDLLLFCAERGVLCPVPIPTRNGSSLLELAGRPAALFRQLSGTQLALVRSRHCAEVGRALASLHEVTRDFSKQRVNALNVKNWRGLLDPFWSQLEAFDAGAAEEVDSELNWLEAHWPTDLPTGIIHADLFSDNVLFCGDELSGMIDFYFSCYDVYAYDVAIAMNSWCFERDYSFNVTNGRAFLQGYESKRPLVRSEKEKLSILSRGAAMRIFATRIVDLFTTTSSSDVRVYDPREYLVKNRFHRQISTQAGYLW